MRIGIDVRRANPAQPGQQRYLWRLGAWLAGLGHEVHFTTTHRQAPDVVVPAGATLHRLHGLSARDVARRVRALELDVLLLNPERSPGYRGLRANLLRTAYGTEHYHQKGRSIGHPVERAVRGAVRYLPWKLARARWERAFYEGPSPPPRVIAQSGYIRHEILDSYRIPADHVHLVHNAVDTSEFSPARRRELRSGMRKRFSIPEDAFCLVFLGHNFRLKGLWEVLRLLPALLERAPHVHVLVAGRGTGRYQRWKAKRLIARRGLERRVTLAGAVQPSIHALAAADALLHLTWHDSFGFVVLEAMACGLPVVTTPYAGASELVEPGASGLVVDPADRPAIVEAVASLREPDARERIGDAATAVARRHDEPGNFRQVLSIMEIAAAERPGPIG